MQQAFKIGQDEVLLALSRAASGYRLHWGDTTLAVDLQTGRDGRGRLRVGAQHYDVVIAVRGDDVFIHVDGEAYELRYRHPLDRLAAAGAGSTDRSVRAPMPGSIVKVEVAAGDTVSKGQVLLVMESMKMETTLLAPRDGVVAEIRYAQGQTFERDAVLLELVHEAH